MKKQIEQVVENTITEGVSVIHSTDNSLKKLRVLRPPMIYGKGSKGNYPVLAKLAKKTSSISRYKQRKINVAH